MTDFIPSLRQEIVEATARYERRRTPVRALAVLAPPRGVRAPLSAALAGVVALLAVVALVTLDRPSRHDTTAPPPAQPRVVARLAPAESGGSVAGGFGAMWLQDTTRGRLLRVDARTRRVVASIPIAGNPQVATGAGAVWALTGGNGYTFPGPLLVIDPRTNRISDRIPLATPAGEPFTGQGVVPVAGAVWVFGPDGAIRVDGRSHRVTASVTVPISRGFVVGGVAHGGSLWLITYDGRMLRLDARTGARLASAHTTAGDSPDAADATGIYVSGPGAIARLDAASGRQIWRVATPAEPQGVTVAHGRVWAAYGGDVLSTYDPATGRRRSMTRLPDFVGADLAATASDIWVLGDNGKVDVVKP
jgi:outer membrane protein assembly factor BamB